MIKLEKTIHGTTYKTEFNLKDDYREAIEEVLQCLNGKTVTVLSSTGEYDKVISVIEWLPLVCSSVSFNTDGARYTRGADPTSQGRENVTYRDIITNLVHMQPLEREKKIVEEEEKPFQHDNENMGIITLSRDLKRSRIAFCFALAHELTHAISRLENVYLAVVNWKKFINCCEEGLIHDEAHFEWTTVGDILDGEPYPGAELEVMENYFGTAVQEWAKGYERYCREINRDGFLDETNIR